jgi:outer membrane cobalamin receptor
MEPAISLALSAWLLAARPPSPPAATEPFSEVVVVTATTQPQRIVDSVAMVTVLAEEELDSSPNLVLDEQLRQVPGFSLLRRTSSLGAHPTTQGVSLRGVGTSGASRTLVLLDGLPLNDPFGGWVYWSQAPTGALDSIEVVRGATSQLYGSAAMGGTVQMLTLDASRVAPELAFRAGARSTWDAAGSTGGGTALPYLVTARAMDTAGYFALRESARGPVDRPLEVASQSLYARVEPGPFRLGVHAYRETRGNGTAAQQNASRLGRLTAAFSRGSWRATAFAGANRFESRFSRILPQRDAEVVTADQLFTYWSAGATVARRLSSGWLVGADARSVSWDAETQTLSGAYAQWSASPTPRLELLGGARLDVWNNEKTQVTVNPRLGALLRLGHRASVRASAYRGFRAPTLNELYRPFRVGNIETLANPLLGEEHLLGAELGLDLHPSADVLLRVNAFLSRLDDTIGNVTLEIRDGEILRQRENVDRVEVEGIEVELRLRLGRLWSLRAAYQLADSRVDASELRLPQLPLHEGSLGVGFRSERVDATVQARWSSSQFEDDLNQLPLGRAFVADLGVSVDVTSRLSLTASAENLLDADVAVARTPLELLAAPRTLLVGLRVR